MKAGFRVTQQVQQGVQDGVAVLTLDRPPGNALVPGLRAALIESLHAACDDPAIRAIVLNGAGAGFSAGIDLGEFSAAPADPPLGELCTTIEDASKPVVVALHGSAFGAGFELALAAHGRVAQRGTRVSLPEVTLSMVPGGGATQRLPRLVGAQAALELMLSGRAVEATDARLAPVFDRIVDATPLDAAVALARGLSDRGTWRRTRDRQRGLADARAYQSAIAAAAARIRDDGSAEADILACVEAAQLLPFEQGLIFEQERFAERLARPEARGIRHVFTAERRAAALPKQLAETAPQLRTAALVGTGPRLAGLALVCLSAGLAVQVFTGGTDKAAEVIDEVQAGLDHAVRSGKLAEAVRDRRLAQLSVLETPGGLGAVDLVLDLGALSFERPVGPGQPAVWALLDDDTSAAARASSTGAEGRLVRLRLPLGGPAARLVEVATPPDTPAGLAAGVHRAFSNNGRSVLLSSEATGFLSDVMGAALFGAALVMLAGGVPAGQIDAAARGLGLGHGPFRLIDELGAQSTLARMRRIFEARQISPAPLRILSDRIIDVGADPSRALAFHVPAGQSLEPDAGLADWVAGWREAQPAYAVAWPGTDPAVALHAALVNEAARLIETRAVQRRSDPDLVMVRGFGMARSSGGPLLQSDIRGLLGLVRAMRPLREVAPALWSPTSLLDEMVKNGRSFF